MAGIDALKKFYVFVQSQGGWENVANAADSRSTGGNGNGTVEKIELKKYLDGEWVEYEDSAFETIWAKIDTFTKGDIEGTRVENLGALDEDEAGKINSKAAEFSTIINAIEDNWPGNLNLNGTGINESDLKYALAVALIEQGIDPASINESMINNQIVSVVRNLILQKTLQAYDNTIKNKNLIGYDENGQSCRYSLANDENLTDLINRYLQNNSNLTVDGLSNFAIKIKQIIEAYMNTAGLVWDYEAPNPPLESAYQYGDGGDDVRINNLQKARLLTAITDALNPNNLMENDKFKNAFENWETQLNAVAKNYIKNQLSVWSGKTQAEFWAAFGATPDNHPDFHNMWRLAPQFMNHLQGDFYNSNECQNLLNVIEIGGLGGEIPEFLEGIEGNSVNWSQFYGQPPYNTDDTRDKDPRRFVAILYYFGGMGGLGDDANGNNTMQRLFQSDFFKGCLKTAYTYILEHADEYGITSDSTQKDMQNALLKYFKDNLAEILDTCGFGDYEIAYALANSATHTAELVNFGNDASQGVRAGAYGQYSEDDIVAHVQAFIDFVKSHYSDKANVINALKSLEDAVNAGSIKNMTGEQVNKLMELVLRALDETLPKPGDGNPPIDPPSPTATAGELDLSVLDLNAYNDKEQRVESANAAKEKIKSEVFKTLENSLKEAMKAALGAYYDETLFNRIYSLAEYYTLIAEGVITSYKVHHSNMEEDKTYWVAHYGVAANKFKENFENLYTQYAQQWVDLKSGKNTAYLDQFNTSYKPGVKNLKKHYTFAKDNYNSQTEAADAMKRHANSEIDSFIPDWRSDMPYKKETWNAAISATKSYIGEVISSILNGQINWHDVWENAHNGNTDKKDTLNGDYVYYLDEDQSASQGHDFSNCSVESPSGIYLAFDDDGAGCNHEFYFRFDMNRIWEIFKEKLGAPDA